jgi:hypothetical protein
METFFERCIVSRDTLHIINIFIYYLFIIIL